MIGASLDACVTASPPLQVLWFIPPAEEHAHPVYWRIELRALDDQHQGMCLRGTEIAAQPLTRPASLFSAEDQNKGAD